MITGSKRGSGRTASTGSRWRGDVCPIDVSDIARIPGMADVVSIIRQRCLDVVEVCDELQKVIDREND